MADDPRPRLTMATALPGTRVVCVDDKDGRWGLRAGNTYTLRLCAEFVEVDGNKYVHPYSAFVLADPPALPAMTPELVAACVEMHAEIKKFRDEKALKLTPSATRFVKAAEACPGLLAPPPPRTTDATFWLGEAA